MRASSPDTGHFAGDLLARRTAAAIHALLASIALYGGVISGGEPTAIRFVRGGAILQGEQDFAVHMAGQPVATDSISLDAGRRLVRFEWTSSTAYEIASSADGYTTPAPIRPAPYVVRIVPLEDVSQAAAAGAAPDAMVRFAPDSRRLAVATFGGRLRVLDAYTGRMIHDARIAEGLVKQIAWSPDGRTLYAGEQSPDAELFALRTDAEPYERTWSVRLADDLGTSRPPANDRFGIYTLPAVYDLKIADDGRVFAAGLHSWTVNGRLRNRSMLYCFTPEGGLVWRFPPAGAAPMSIAHFAIDAAGRSLIFLASQSQAPQGDEPLRTDTLYQLNGETGRITARFQIDPLRPFFERIESWDSAALSADGERAAIGLNDGRVLLFRSRPGTLELAQPIELAAPRVIGKTPVAAPASYTRIFGDRLCLQTQYAYVPLASSQAARHAPSLHRGANTLTVADLDGTPLWRYRGPFALGGAWSDQSLPGGKGRWLLVACRERPGQEELGQFGFLLFDQTRTGGGSRRLVYHYPTCGPISFQSDLSPNGLLAAVVEVPMREPDGEELRGAHQLHVVH